MSAIHALPRASTGHATKGATAAPHAPAAPAISADSSGAAQSLAGQQALASTGPSTGGCTCGSDQATAAQGALGAPDGNAAAALAMPASLTGPQASTKDTGGSTSGGATGGKLASGTAKKLAGEPTHAGLTAKAQSILGSAQAVGLKLISGRRSGESGGHGDGSAVDVSNVPGGSKQQSATMERFAESVRAAGKAGDPRVGYVIYRQRIASARDNWAWRPMQDRGSNTQNHFDHVHVSTDPNR